MKRSQVQILVAPPKIRRAVEKSTALRCFCSSRSPGICSTCARINSAHSQSSIVTVMLGFTIGTSRLAGAAAARSRPTPFALRLGIPDGALVDERPHVGRTNGVVDSVVSRDDRCEEPLVGLCPIRSGRSKSSSMGERARTPTDSQSRQSSCEPVVCLLKLLPLLWLSATRSIETGHHERVQDRKVPDRERSGSREVRIERTGPGMREARCGVGMPPPSNMDQTMLAVVSARSRGITAHDPQPSIHAPGWSRGYVSRIMPENWETESPKIVTSLSSNPRFSSRTRRAKQGAQHCLFSIAWTTGLFTRISKTRVTGERALMGVVQWGAEKA